MSENLAWVKVGRSSKEHRAVRGSEIAYCGVRITDTSVWTNRSYQPCAECVMRDPGRAEFIEFLIDYLSSVGTIRTTYMAYGKKQAIRPSFFDGAEPFLKTDLTHSSESSLPNESTLDHDPDIGDVVWPMDLRMISRLGDRQDGSEDDQKKWTIQRYRSLDTKAVRGRVSIALPYPVEWTIAVPAQDRVQQYLVGRAAQGKWLHIDNLAHHPSETIQSLDGFLSERMALGLNLWYMRPMQWRVYLGLDSNPGIELPTDPIGAAAIFRLRDIPEGRSRRLALRHWVTEHWRQRRADPAEESKVREHLRGATSFTWNGLRCKIRPSRVDMDRESQAIERRALEHMTGSDRRRKQ